MTPPGTLRVILLLVRTSLLRQVNRLSVRFGGRRRQDGSARKATARRRPGRLVLAVLSLLFLWQAVFLSTMFIGRLAVAVELAAPAGRLSVYRSTYQDTTRLRARCGADADCLRDEKLGRTLPQVVASDPAWRQLTPAAQEAIVERLLALAQSDHLDDGLSRRPDGPGAFVLLGSALYCAPEHRPAMAMGVALLLTLLAVTFLLNGLGSAEQGRQWALEWLFTLPVPARTLLLARVAELALGDLLAWFTAMPLLAVAGYGAGLGWWAVPAALLATVYLNVLVAALVIPLEALAQRHLDPSRLGTLRATATTFGGIGFLGAIALATTPPGAEWLAKAATVLPGALGLLPPALPVQLLGDWPGRVAAVMALALLPTAWAGAHAAAGQLSEGLVAVRGPYQGSRRPGKQGGALVDGMLGKELRLLARNRSFLSQTIILPALALGFQVIINPRLLRGAATDARNLAMLAFSLGTYAGLSANLSLLASEGEALWILATLPRDLVGLLLGKLRLWIGVALAWSVATLVAGAVLSPSLDLATLLPAGATALLGVVVYSFIAAGIGALNTDVFETEARRRVQPLAAQSVLLLAGMYAVAIYTPDLWPKLAQVTLSTLVAIALWQKVRDAVPFLLDGTAAPPPRVALADGLIAALAFLVAQGVVILIIVQVTSGPPSGPELVFAFAFAGILVAALALYTFWRQKVPDLLRSVGLRGGRVALAVPLGVGGGALAAAAGVGWLRLSDAVPLLAEWKRGATRPIEGIALDATALLVLAVVAAPLCEEFIFRGLVYRGLRRSYPLGVAVLASAAIFAIVHPAFSAPPVFVLAVIAALVFERTGLLLAPMLTHAVYNAVVVLYQR